MAGMESLKLSNGNAMPVVGFGTWMLSASDAENAVAYALACGYRHVDCAIAYGNEDGVGRGLNRAFNSKTVTREDIFITGKLPNMAHRAEDVLPTLKKTLTALSTEYLDLYLIHWGLATKEGHREPDFMNIPIRETWEAMEELVQKGLVRAIGVANFTAPMLIDLLSYAKTPPAVNQIELHPYLQQPRVVSFCQSQNIAVTAYSPLGRPGAELSEHMPRVVDDPVIRGIAEAHGKTAAQIALRWGIQRNTAVIPKSTHKERIRENLEIFDFTLSEKEMAALAGIDRHMRLVDPYIWADIPYFD